MPNYRLRIGARVAADTVMTCLSGSYTLSGQSVNLDALPVGALTTDGQATPEQIALWLPVSSSLPTTATATCRYRLQGAGSWTTGHPLYRTRPTLSEDPATPSAGTVTKENGFAWTIIDLTPGSTYEVEVTVTSGVSSTVKTLTHTTRALPAAAAPANKTASNLTNFQTLLGSAVAGDVIELAEGSFAVTTPINITQSGNTGSPIIIRGASRTNTVLTRSTHGYFFTCPGDVSNVIIENMTFTGNGVDATGTRTTILDTYSTSADLTRFTIRNTIASGIDRGVYLWYNQACMIYNNTWRGNNPYSVSPPPDYLGSSITWDDDGINMAGDGNVAFNNTMAGFGDTFAYCHHADSNVVVGTNATHFYRNLIEWSCDDALEADHMRRNCTWYDNSCYNTINADSLDPLYAGPWLSARNTYVNIFRIRTHKWNATNSGQFLYNNTYLQTNSLDGAGNESGWYQPGNGIQDAYGYRNNIHIDRGPGGNAIYFSNPQPSILDWTHNSWWPNRTFHWDETGSHNYASLAAAQAGLPNKTPIFSGTNRPMENDVIASSNPWSATVTLGANGGVKYTNYATNLALAAGTSKNTGVVIPNITDGYSGALPDRGGVIAGRAAVLYGDQTPEESDVPYSVPTVANTFTTINQNVLLNAVPPGWVGSENYYQDNLFGDYGGPVFVPNFGTHGALVFSNTGGHGDGSQVDMVYVDFADGEWKYQLNGNGVAGRSGAFTLSETSNSPWYEVNAATSGKFPAPGHPYRNTLAMATEDGTNGAIIWVGRGAITDAGPSYVSMGCHYQDLTTRQWNRRTSNTAAYGVTTGHYEGSSCYDSGDGRYYYASSQSPNQWNYLSYVRQSDWTWQVTPTWSVAPPATGGVMFCCSRLRMLIWHTGNAFWGLNLNSIASGWQAITTSGASVPTSGHNQWIHHTTNDKFYWKAGGSGSQLYSLAPPAGNVATFTGWVVAQVNITGTLPARTAPNDHYSCLFYVPAHDCLGWAANGNASGIALIKV